MRRATLTEWKDRAGMPHPRIQVEAANLTEAFEEAAHAFMDLFTDRAQIEPRERVVIFCESSDSDWLFSDWINTLIYEIRERRMVFSEFRITVEGINVKGEIWGEPIDPSRHPLKLERLSGAAFDELFAIEENGRGRVSAVLNDSARHPLPLRKLWESL